MGYEASPGSGGAEPGVLVIHEIVNLRFAPLMDMGFAVLCLLAQRSRLLFGFCSSARAFAPRFLQTRLAATPLRFTNPSQPKADG